MRQGSGLQVLGQRGQRTPSFGFLRQAGKGT